MARIETDGARSDVEHPPVHGTSLWSRLSERGRATGEAPCKRPRNEGPLILGKGGGVGACESFIALHEEEGSESVFCRGRRKELGQVERFARGQHLSDHSGLVRCHALAAPHIGEEGVNERVAASLAVEEDFAAPFDVPPLHSALAGAKDGGKGVEWQ